MSCQPSPVAVPRVTRPHGAGSECGFTLIDVMIAVPANVAAAHAVTLSASAVPPPGSTLQAAPRDGQIGERCCTLDIDQAGVKIAVIGGCW